MSVWFAVGAILAGLGVVLGAFGAHALQGRVEPRFLEVFETGVRYHMYHALALLAVGLAASRVPSPPSALLGAAAWAFLAGIVLFSGSLYAMTLTGASKLGAITPLGGVAFIVGWMLLAASVLSRRA